MSPFPENSESYSRSAIFAVISAACVVLAAISAQGAEVAELALPTQVVDALRANAAGLGPLTIEWQRTRDSAVDGKEFTRDVASWPRKEFVAPLRVQFALFEEMFYCKKYSWHLPRDLETLDYLYEEPLVDQVGECSFNGQNVYTGTTMEGSYAEETDPMLGIRPLEQVRDMHPWKTYGRVYYFQNAGFFLATKASDLGTAPQSTVTRLLDRGAELVHVDDDASPVRIRIATPEGDAEYWLDPELAYAVRRWREYTSGGALRAEGENGDFVKLGSRNVWLPKQCSVQVYLSPYAEAGVAPADSPVYTETFTVQSIDAGEIPRERFTLNYTKPGTWISNGSLPGADQQPNKWVTYQVPAPPQTFTDIVWGKSAIPWRLIIIAANIVVFSLLVYLFWRSRRKRLAQ